MSVFDFFRGFLGVPRGHYRGYGRREPFFDGMTHGDDEDEDEAFQYEDHFDDTFTFSVGPNEVFVQEPRVFGQMLREMEELFAGLDVFGQGFPSIEIQPQERPERRGGGSGNSLRDFMLKTPDDSLHSTPSLKPKHGEPSSVVPNIPRSPFHHWSPFSMFKDSWNDEPTQRDVEKKEDGDLDSQVSSAGLDEILTPAPQPRTRSFFQSVTVTKVVKPDGTVEERRTVRDSQGKEETTVTRSGGPEGPQDQPDPLIAGGPQLSPDMQDKFSVFTKFFGGFRG
ncbi:HCLS1-associated protein X-1 isoform X1 [Electrophorus electricus]|uniref:HCLS1-associated protein X-1 isoform X1 n=1 Tax=Electrophorus electricus TaxID=8005 RepID=UPI000F0A011B|nr:HCLS1-associated protein X-1 isoform X1 [Electrophorus electricus]